MTHAAHLPMSAPAPTCLGCGAPMAPTPAGHYTCDHTGVTPPPYDLGVDTAPIRPRERRIHTTTAVDVWDDYRPEGT